MESARFRRSRRIFLSRFAGAVTFFVALKSRVAHGMGYNLGAFWKRTSNPAPPSSTNYTLWAWGADDYGALGLGDTLRRSSPVQVGSLSTWLKASSGFYTAHAIKADGTLWGFG